MPQSLFLDTLQGKCTDRPPVWFMRQAGRVLPNYMDMRDQYGFKEMMDTPELAAKVTLLPIDDLGVDAAILFSDILVIPEAMGMELSFEGKGPSFKVALKDVEDPNLFLKEQPEKLQHIYKAIDLIKQQKPEHIPLIGFCGGPLTTLCYMYQGFSQNLNFPDVIPALYRDTKVISKVIDRITEMSIEYAKNQVAHGIDAFQLFETHAGLVPSDIYQKLFLPSVKKILTAVRDLGVKTIFLPKGLGTGLSMVNYDLCDCISVDWQVPLEGVRQYVGNEITLQGNFDPRILQTTPEVITDHFNKYLEFGQKEHNWIFNLGHGLLPTIPVDNVKHLVNLVKDSDWKR
ncbi:uroporphyrinogen decarboxylase [Halosquirtibacter xylanolyticus]|uniref:uroporphyrinogen decarboxylase n=1 Tax=Halosquirtibacter xylanolyticus TaxID=3374599 RepID=UPI00374880D4|nr:uroporphyrinogen decarboxylase [Prolixibacteraceae bacterium]